VISCPGLNAPQHLQVTLAADAGSSGTPSADGEAVLTPSDQSLAEPTPVDPFQRLQRRLLLATLLLTLVVTLISWPVFGASAARSLLLGGSCGILYLRLLARSVSRIGPDSRSLGRFQIVVPALLVVAAARIPALELLPALLGFLLYKPALLLQAVLAP
jgi:ATP synthase protein I